MRIENPQERRFYEIECARQNWNSRYLQRQYALLEEKLREWIAEFDEKQK